MPRRVVISKVISEMIGGFGLSRTLLVKLFTRLHTEFPAHAAEFTINRFPDDNRLFQYPTSIIEGNRRHTFLLFVDDSTSPDHWLLHDIQYTVHEL